MSVYLGYNEVTKQYLRSLGGGGGTITVSDSSGDLSASGFTMSGDINMSGNEVVGLDDPSGDSSAASKKYVDDEVAKVNTGSGGGLDQATADGRYLQKTDASSTYETQSDASNTYLSKTDASSTYAPIRCVIHESWVWYESMWVKSDRREHGRRWWFICVWIHHDRRYRYGE